jgi:hypothetical protein
MLEHHVEDILRLGIKALGGLCIKLNPLGYVGIPDRMVLLPGGRLVFVELKIRKGIAGRLQGRWRTKLTALGFRVEWLWSADEVKDFLCSL